MIDLNTEELKNFLNDNPGAKLSSFTAFDETRVIIYATDENGTLVPSKALYYLMPKTEQSE